MINFRTKTRTAPPAPLAPQGRAFSIHTRIGRAVGKDSRYSCGAVRALPSVNKDEVVLQATDGHQAVCLLTPGQMAESRLVPPEVLPTRQLPRPAAVRLVDGHWQTSEGRIAEDRYSTGEGAFAPVATVLPAVGKRPFYETAAQAERRRASGHAETPHVMLGIDVELLRKVAEALGSSKLTLFVPVPVKHASTAPAEAFVNKPVPVCPATDEGQATGVAAVMPLQPVHGNGYYEKVRAVISASEQQSAGRAAKTRSRDVPPTRDTALAETAPSSSGD